MLKNYDWILFDADGTLFDYDRAESVALKLSFEQVGLNFAPEHLIAYRAINRDLWHALEKQQVGPDELKVRRFELLLRSIGISFPAAEFSAVYLQKLSECSELLPGAETVVAGLAPHVKLAILTNGLEAVQTGRLAGSPIRHWFQHMVISEQVRAAKPSAPYFQAAWDRLGRPEKHRCLMVGDSWTSDVTGAAAFGFHTCWLNARGEARPVLPVITLEVRSLNELSAWLGIA